MEKNCPYCKNELIKGFIDSGKYSFKWHDEKAGFIERNTVFGGEILSDKALISCYRCEYCKKIVIDLEEL